MIITKAERSGGPACPCCIPVLCRAQLPSTGPQPSSGPKPVTGSWTSAHRADTSTEVAVSIEASSTNFFTSVSFLKISSNVPCVLVPQADLVPAFLILPPLFPDLHLHLPDSWTFSFFYELPSSCDACSVSQFLTKPWRIHQFQPDRPSFLIWLTCPFYVKSHHTLSFSSQPMKHKSSLCMVPEACSFLFLSIPTSLVQTFIISYLSFLICSALSKGHGLFHTPLNLNPEAWLVLSHSSVPLVRETAASLVFWHSGNLSPSFLLWTNL